MLMVGEIREQHQLLLAMEVMDQVVVEQVVRDRNNLRVEPILVMVVLVYIIQLLMDPLL